MNFALKLFFVLFLISFLNMSCSKKVVDQKKMESYLSKPQNGLVQEEVKEKLKVVVQFRPSCLILKQHLKAINSTSQATIDSLSKIYNKNLYFILRMTYDDQELLSIYANDHKKFSEMVSRLSFEMDKYISLTTADKDTLQMVDFIYPRMYGMSGNTEIMLVFENKLSNFDMLFFNIDEFGLNQGKMKFKFKYRDIKAVPQLTFKENE